jgi:phenylpropionate dioxygenase-like ring-hydroxylating dioxygenase large terminal subunit
VDGSGVGRDGVHEHGALQARLIESVKPAEGSVPAFIFSSPDVYEAELQRVFARSWLFVGHESEVPEPGDYVTRYMGEDPVIVTRGEDGQIRVFLNVCRHRGMRLCRADMGNTSHFRCPYHGFTYDNRGHLVGVPFHKEAYGDDLDRASLSLFQPRCESYAGLVFATWSEAGPSLGEFLGDARWYLDLLFKRAAMEVVGPPQRWVVDTNWKLPADNFASDAYHTATTHASIAAIGLTPSIAFGKDGYHISLSHGHGCGLGIGPTPMVPEEMLALYARHLPPAQAAIWRQIKNLHGTLFPNFSLLLTSAAGIEGKRIMHTTMRLWQPKGPDKIEIWSWLIVERDAPDEWKELSRKAYILTFGPSGIFEQDDTENWAHITANARGAVARRAATFNYTMGLGRTPLVDGFAGPGAVTDTKFQEANARNFYGRWLEMMLA